jgi:hypothetical protein
MMRSLSALVAALVLFSASSVGAQQDYARSGAFVGVMGVFARQQFEDDVRDQLNDQLAALGYAVDTELAGSFGIEVLTGYRFHRYFSVEVGGEWLAAFEGDVALTNAEHAQPEFPAGLEFLPEIAEMDFETATVTGSLKAHLLTGRYQPFLRVGGGMMTVKGRIETTGRVEREEQIRDGELKPRYELWPGIDVSDRWTGAAMRFGGGLDLYAFDIDSFVISAGADYVLPFGEVEDFDYVRINVGFQYRF